MEPVCREIILSATDSAAQAYAVQENGHLVEYGQDDGGKMGAVYCCRVTEYVKAFKACFCEIGEERRGYLNSDAYRAGDWVLCQVSGEAHDTKGMRLTDNVKLTGAYLVLLEGNTVGISGKIQDDINRNRLKKIGDQLIASCVDASVGLIFRTESQYASDADIMQEFKALRQKAIALRDAFNIAKKNGNPTQLYQPDFGAKILFRYPPSTISTLYCDHPVYANTIETQYPIFAGKVHLCKAPAMDTAGITRKMATHLGRKVWLKCGGYLIFDRTEAMTVIDVNSGKTSGIHSSRELAKTVNFQAAEEILRSIRLRSIGGMILCDMIDMTAEEDREELLEFMRKMAENDPDVTQIHDITKLGIVEITRKRTKNTEYLDKRG